MHATVRWLVIALATVSLVACTRERPTPPPTATSALSSAPAAQPAESGPALEPQVSSTTPQAGAAPILTPTVSLVTTPTPSGETFQYVVKAGDTLGSIALQFGTDIDTLRQLNNLDSDALYVGQPVYVPYVEGMTAEGMPTPTPGPVRYTIQPGDTLSALALRFGVSTIEIIETNNLLNPENLTVGSTIIIPGAQPEPGTVEQAGAGETSSPSGGASVLHIVQQGEGLFDIADLYGVSADAIAEANNISNRNMLRVGQELTIPGVSTQQAAAARGNIHVVQAGESLLGIAVQYGVTVEEILIANEINNPDAIFEGQELIIPGD